MNYKLVIATLLYVFISVLMAYMQDAKITELKTQLENLQVKYEQDTNAKCQKFIVKKYRKVLQLKVDKDIKFDEIEVEPFFLDDKEYK